MRNWKTTLFGTISALASFVAFSPQYFPPIAIDMSRFILAGGLLALGLTAKDYTTTGTGKA